MDEANYTVCDACGAVLADEEKHKRWHAGLAKELYEAVNRRVAELVRSRKGTVLSDPARLAQNPQRQPFSPTWAETDT